MQVCVRRQRLDVFVRAAAHAHHAGVQRLHVNRALGAEDAQCVLRLAGGMCHGEGSISPAFELEHCDGRVVHLALECDVAHHARDAVHWTKEIEQHLDAMAAEIEHRATP